MLPSIVITALLVASTSLIPYQDAYARSGRMESENVRVYTIEEKIELKSKEYGVDIKTVKDIINCESGFNSTLQSKHIYKQDYPVWGMKKGDREQSYGLVQIHLPSHPSITYEQAIDIDFSLEFLIKNLSEGRGDMWSCYKDNGHLVSAG